MRKLFAVLLLPIVALLAACGAAAEGPKGPQDPLDSKPAAVEVLAMSDEFGFTFMPGEAISDVEWDVEFDYDTRDVQAVFDFYDNELSNQGFTRTSIDAGSDEIEAEYSNVDGVEIDLEVERDDSRVEVDLDVDDLTGPYLPGFSLKSFQGVDIPVYGGADVVDVEWDFNFDHPSTGSQEVFDYYDGHLQSLGWNQTELDDGDDDEMEAEYVKDGVHLELEAEGDTEVELEFNKLRFY